MATDYITADDLKQYRRDCCNGHCNQGRSCPARNPAEAATEIGADGCHPPATRTGLLLIVAPWAAAVIGWALYAALA